MQSLASRVDTSLFFAGDFAMKLIELGQKDVRRWIDDAHDDGAWQLRPVGATTVRVANGGGAPQRGRDPQSR